MFILTAAMGTLALLATNQWATSNDQDVQSKAESAVASDLSWIKNYAKIWKMDTGPYDLTTAQTKTSSYTVSLNNTSYAPEKTLCDSDNGLANDFLNDAITVSTSPAKPFNVASGRLELSSTANQNPQGLTPPPTVFTLPNGMKLWRTISTTRLSGSPANLIYISYNLEDNTTNQLPYQFAREVALRLEAASWCP